MVPSNEHHNGHPSMSIHIHDRHFFEHNLLVTFFSSFFHILLFLIVVYIVPPLITAHEKAISVAHLIAKGYATVHNNGFLIKSNFDVRSCITPGSGSLNLKQYFSHG